MSLFFACVFALASCTADETLPFAYGEDGSDAATPAPLAASAPEASPTDEGPLPACPCFFGEGAYCGRTVAAEASRRRCTVAEVAGHTDDVLDCAGGAWSLGAACADGCFTAPIGQDDGCQAQKAIYHLPWPCATTVPVTQGNHGDICGSFAGDHVGDQVYAFDFGTPRGTPVLAARGGTVTQVVNASPPGSPCNDGCPQPFGTAAFSACCSACLNQANWVDVAHGDGTVATYFHLDRTSVSVGQVVAQGAMLGLSGTSGCSSGPHLHFQVMGDCPTTVCASIPMTFDEAGAPACGLSETSANACP